MSAWIAALLLAWPAFAGAGTGPSAQQPIRTQTQAVEVDVRVFDRSGQFVATLTGDDFEIFEDGVRQDVLALYLVEGASARVPGAAGPTSAAAPDVAAAARQTWVFVFDTVHLSPGGADRARQAVQAFIRDRFTDGDMGGVVSGGRMIGNRLTSVRSELEEAAGAVALPANLRSRELERREWPRFLDDLEPLQIARNDRETLRTVITRACTDDPSMCSRGVDPEPMVREKAARVAAQIRGDTLTTLKTTAALASGLSRVPGPKTIVFVSDGFVVEGMEEAVQAAAGQAARAGARFYTIDARGLNRGYNAGLIDQRAADDPAGAGPRFDLQADGTTALAVDTGGLAIRNENDVGRALDRIARDTNTYYVIGYRPSNPTFDGKYRRIEVKLRKPGLEARARRGYLALEPSRMLAPVPATPPAPAPAAPPPAPPSGGELTLPGVEAARPTLPADDAAPAPRVRGNAAEMVNSLAGDAVTSRASGGRAADGWAAYQRGDLETAAKALREAAAEGNARPWVYYALGFALLAQGERPEAAQAWEQVRAAVPEFQAVYYDLADLRVQTGEDEAAIAVLREAEKRWPSEPDVYNALGVIQVRRGALDEAVGSFETAVKLAPDQSLAVFNLARALQMRYFKSHRYLTTQRRWVGNEQDRERSAALYEKYLEMGGPYEQQARDALGVLAWKKR